MKNKLKICTIISIATIITACGSYPYPQQAIDGKIYMIDYDYCQSYRVIAEGTIQCMDKNRNPTQIKRAMTREAFELWKFQQQQNNQIGSYGHSRTNCQKIGNSVNCISY